MAAISSVLQCRLCVNTDPELEMQCNFQCWLELAREVACRKLGRGAGLEVPRCCTWCYAPQRRPSCLVSSADPCKWSEFAVYLV